MPPSRRLARRLVRGAVYPRSWTDPVGFGTWFPPFRRAERKGDT